MSDASLTARSSSFNKCVNAALTPVGAGVGGIEHAKRGVGTPESHWQELATTDETVADELFTLIEMTEEKPRRHSFTRASSPRRADPQPTGTLCH